MINLIFLTINQKHKILNQNKIFYLAIKDEDFDLIDFRRKLDMAILIR